MKLSYSTWNRSLPITKKYIRRTNPIKINNLSTGNNFVVDTMAFRTTFEITDIPELHNGIIAAAAKEWGMPLLTNDPKI
jgi:hypothetical protein